MSLQDTNWETSIPLNGQFTAIQNTLPYNLFSSSSSFLFFLIFFFKKKKEETKKKQKKKKKKRRYDAPADVLTSRVRRRYSRLFFFSWRPPLPLLWLKLNTRQISWLLVDSQSRLPRDVYVERMRDLKCWISRDAINWRRHPVEYYRLKKDSE